MTLVVDIFRSLLPAKAKSSPSGWTSFNAPCCHHRGHAQDTRKRGGVRFDQGVVYNCFNCKYTASWLPGRPISARFKSLCRWMGANDDDINKMVFEALKAESPEYVYVETEKPIAFTEKELPEGAMPINKWVSGGQLDHHADKLQPVISYLIDRGCDPMDDNFWWTPSAGFDNRVIIPFMYEGKVVGSTARKVSNGRPKYVSDQHPHFVFNIDAQTEDHQYVFVVEGPFDALAVGGVALLTNDIAEQQAKIINSLGVKVIVVPDQDEAGLNLYSRAIENDWGIASPNWEDDVKDCAEAVQRYGKLFVVVDIIKTAEFGEIKITMAKHRQEHKLERQQHVEEIKDR